MGKSPLTGGGSHGHKQRRVGDYLLFKQIAGLCGRGWKGPWTSLHFWCLKVPARALAVLLRNNELSGQNSLWIPGWTASGNAEPFCWLVSRHAEHSPGSGCLGGSGDCQAAAQLTQISFVENYLMSVRPLLSIQTTENIYCCSSSQEMHISVPPPTPYSLTFTVSSIPQTIFTIFHINVMWMIDATSAIKKLLAAARSGNIMTTVSFLNQVQANTCRPRKTSPELCSPCGGQKHESSHTEPTTDQGPKTTVVKTDENKIPAQKWKKSPSHMKKKQVKMNRCDVGWIDPCRWTSFLVEWVNMKF